MDLFYTSSAQALQEMRVVKNPGGPLLVLCNESRLTSIRSVALQGYPFSKAGRETFSGAREEEHGLGKEIPYGEGLAQARIVFGEGLATRTGPGEGKLAEGIGFPWKSVRGLG